MMESARSANIFRQVDQNDAALFPLLSKRPPPPFSANLQNFRNTSKLVLRPQILKAISASGKMSPYQLMKKSPVTTF